MSKGSWDQYKRNMNQETGESNTGLVPFTVFFDGRP